jgi:hypothetical protein
LASCWGSPASSTSYHLRQLAKHDFVREVEGKGNRQGAVVGAAALVAWAASRGTRPEEAVRQLEAAALRRDELNLLRADMLGAAHSGLPPQR